MPQQHPRTIRPSDETLGAYLVWMNSYDLALRAKRRSDRTRLGYRDDLRLFASWLRRMKPKHRSWDQVTKTDIREYFVWLQDGGRPCPHQLVDDPPPAKCEGYAVGYVRHAAVGVQQFFAWWAKEEDCSNPCADVELPAQQGLGKSLVPVHEDDEISALIKDAEKGKDFTSRRDIAQLRFFAVTGVRLEEMAGMNLGDVNLARREAVVTGKGDKTRRVRFDDKCAIAIDRYLRARAKRPNVPMNDDAPLWVGHIRKNGFRMTASGIRQAMVKRARRLGIRTWPHRWRHNFAHRYLDAGGNEGDLMELMGWESGQMLSHYGRSARNSRALRAYDRVNVMGDI